MTLNRVRVMAFNANFNNISVIYIVAGSFNDGENRHTWRKPPYLEKTADMPQVIDELYHIMLFRAGFKLTTSVVIGTDCIGSYEHNYHTITTTSV